MNLEGGPVTAGAQFRFQSSLCAILGGQTGAAAKNVGLSPACQRPSTGVPYFISIATLIRNTNGRSLRSIQIVMRFWKWETL